MAVTPNRQRGWLPPETPITGTRWMLCAVPDDSQLRYREAFLGAIWKLAVPYYWEKREDLDIPQIAVDYREYWWQSMDITEAIQQIIVELARIADSSEAGLPELTAIANAQSIQMPLQTAAQEAQAIALGADIVVPGSASASSGNPVPAWQSLAGIQRGVLTSSQISLDDIMTSDVGGNQVYEWQTAEAWSGDVSMFNNNLTDYLVATYINGSAEWAGLINAQSSTIQPYTLAAGDVFRMLVSTATEPTNWIVGFDPPLPIGDVGLVDKDPVEVNENYYELAPTAAGGCCDPAETVQAESLCQPMDLVAGSGDNGENGYNLPNGAYGRWEAVSTRFGEAFVTVSYNLINNESDLMTLSFAVNGSVKDVQQVTTSGQTTFNEIVNIGDVITVYAQAITAPGAYFEVLPLTLCGVNANNDYLILDSGQSALRAAGELGREAFKGSAGQVSILAGGTAEISQGFDLQLTNLQISSTGTINGTVKIDITDDDGITSTVFSQPYTDVLNESLSIPTDTYRWIKATVSNVGTEVADIVFKIWGQYDS